MLVFALINCENKSATDEEILSEIFPQLIDSLGIRKTNLIPPPPPPLYDKDSNFIGIDSIAAKRILNEQKRQISKIDSNDSRLLIGLVDSSYSIDFNDLLKRTYSDSILVRQVVADNKNKEFDKHIWVPKLIHESNNYQLIYESALEAKYTDLWSIKDRKFAGLISVSKIYLSSDNKIGLLQFELYPFERESASFFIIIELIDKKWQIKRVLLNWIT